MFVRISSLLWWSPKLFSYCYVLGLGVNRTKQEMWPSTHAPPKREQTLPTYQNAMQPFIDVGSEQCQNNKQKRLQSFPVKKKVNQKTICLPNVLLQNWEENWVNRKGFSLLSGCYIGQYIQSEKGTNYYFTKQFTIIYNSNVLASNMHINLYLLIY